ncbi:MAG: efflux RND transporter periplasmic adaptor subunit [Gammaproteobacteria bacterium]|nr:efflux RND transporter periplasmic adaptor subunit [Gammaproteobacteria bacterium]
MRRIAAGPLASILCIVTVSAAAQQPPPAKLVLTAQVERREIAPTVSVPGTIYSRNDVQITAGVTGQLLVVAEPGTVVQQGEAVARIDRTTLLLQRAEQEALLERSEINLRQLESALRRQRELGGSNLVSEFDIEQTEANRDLARSDANIIRVRIRQIDDQIRRTDTVAQFTGIVTERLHRAGEDVARGEVLGRMTDIENMEVRAFVPLKHLGRTRIGESISIFESKSQVIGTIRALIPTGDVRSQTFEARIDLPETVRGAWAVGQLVSVAVPISASEPTLTVPRDALVLRQNGQFVYRINAENIAERIKVSIGDSQGELIAVSGDLREGDLVAIRGAEGLSDGATVRVLTQETATAGTLRESG